MCTPRLRGRAHALTSITDDLGKGLGPALVSVMILSFNRQDAFNMSLIGWIVGGIMSLIMMKFIADDERKIQQHEESQEI